MRRLLALVASALLVLVISGAVLWYFAYGLDSSPPARVTVGRLEAPVQIGWQDNGLATIQAENESGQYTGLGYVHGRARAWSLLLWRQTATGQLGMWFGDKVLALDSLSRRLGFATLAQETYRQLPKEEQARLQAYAAGVNAALDQPSSQLDREMVLFDVQTRSWEPWHTLALERLFAWLATAPPADSVQQASPQIAAFFKTNQQLRRWLHLHSFGHSAAWVASDSAGTHLYRRLVYGASALPFLHEVAIERSDSTYLLGASLPGTPFFPAGQTDEHAWTLLPDSPLRLEPGPWRDTVGTRLHERLENEDGQEYLLRIHRRNGALRIGSYETAQRSSSAPDTLAPGASQTDTSRVAADTTQNRRAWLLKWPGLEEGTDMTSWRALASNGSAAFTLLDGDGLVLTRSGSWLVTGSPRVSASLAGGGMVIGNAHWIDEMVPYLDSLSRRPHRDVAAWRNDCYSAWAAQQAPALVASVDTVHRQLPQIARNAITYLRNWDYTYERSSIAASIFDTWASAYQDSIGTLPGDVTPPDTASAPLPASAPSAPPSPPPPGSPPDTTPPPRQDTTRASRPDTLTATYRWHTRRFRFLVTAVNQLKEQYGDDLSQWRWERVYPARRLFPVWSADSLSPPEPLARTRYAPLELAGRGHPSAPCWGASPVQRGLPAPAAWEGWTSTNAWRQLHVQHRDVDLSGFLNRYRLPDRPPAPRSLEAFSPPAHTTTLVPPS